MGTSISHNETWMEQLLKDIHEKLEKIKLGGGKKAIDKQREKNNTGAGVKVLPKLFLQLHMYWHKNKNGLPCLTEMYETQSCQTSECKPIMH